MGAGRLILGTWNTSDSLASILWSNLFFSLQALGVAQSLVVDTGDAAFIERKAATRDADETIGRYVRQVGPGQTPVCSLEEFRPLLKDLERRNRATLFDSSTTIVLAKADALRLCSQVGSLLVLLEPSPSSASYLYQFLKAPSPQGFTKVSVVVTGTSKLESAALAFAEIKEELTKHIDAPFELQFAGFLCPDPERLSLAQESEKLYLEAFPQDSFQGQIQYSWTRIQAQFGTAEVGALLPFLKSL